MQHWYQCKMQLQYKHIPSCFEMFPQFIAKFCALWQFVSCSLLLSHLLTLTEDGCIERHRQWWSRGAQRCHTVKSLVWWVHEHQEFTLVCYSVEIMEETNGHSRPQALKQLGCLSRWKEIDIHLKSLWQQFEHGDDSGWDRYGLGYPTLGDVDFEELCCFLGRNVWCRHEGSGQSRRRQWESSRQSGQCFRCWYTGCRSCSWGNKSDSWPFHAVAWWSFHLSTWVEEAMVEQGVGNESCNRHVRVFNWRLFDDDTMLTEVGGRLPWILLELSL